MNGMSRDDLDESGRTEAGANGPIWVTKVSTGHGESRQPRNNFPAAGNYFIFGC